MNWNNKRKVAKKLKRNFFMEAMARELDLEYKKAKKKLSTSKVAV